MYGRLRNDFEHERGWSVIDGGGGVRFVLLVGRQSSEHSATEASRWKE